MGPRLSQGTSGATRHIRKIRRILRLRKIHCHPSHRRQEEARCSLRIRGLHTMVHSRQAQSSSAVDSIMPRRMRMRAMENPDEINANQPGDRCVLCVRTVRTFNGTSPQGWSRLGRLARQKDKKQPHTKKQRQPWRTKRTSPTYARRGRRSWASWDVPRPSYLPVSSEGGKDRLTRIPCCSTFGNLHPVVRSGLLFCPRKPCRRDVLIPT